MWSLTSCTHLVWYGRSDDRRHIVSVIEEGGTQHVRFDMVDGPRVRGVGVDALVIDESGHLAYPAELPDGSWVLIRDGVLGPHFDAIGELQARGERLAYTAEKAGKWRVVHDGQSSEAFDTILPGSLTLGPNGRLAFAAQQGTSVFAVIDAQRSAPMDAVGQLRFSPDGSRVGFVGRRQGARFVVIDGEQHGPFESVAELELGPPDVFVARTEGAWRVFVDGRPGEGFDRIAGLNGTAYAGRRGKEEWIVDGERTLGPFTAIKSKLARDSEGRLVFVAQRGDTWTVVTGETENAPWAEVEAPALGGAHVGFIAERNERSVVVIDGREVATWDWAGSLVLSRDGARFAHLARRDDKTVLVVDGVERQVDVAVAGTLAFSKDGRRFACVTGDPKTRRLFISRDDGKRLLVDMEEVVAALSRGNPDALLTSPDVTLLKRWVEAELELGR
ncbi:MAG: hypothetical protein Q8L48_31050 [Archangium sp.]|nr:hypothetical protein [Archangium sp.]